ncbi:transmembrane protein 138-like isoform X1 [Montipora foliosa]|uniref:transmembrane protein 138-like isoform X1 n=1 Tax=Montipora foliosa TaxID=591990 RepID=UPI0035F1752A
MRVSRFFFVVFLQLLFLFVDLFINSFGVLFHTADVVLLVLFIIQDLCIVFAIIVVFLVFFNTYIFQAGLVSLLIRKFKTTIIISVSYLALSVGLHVWTMTLKWGAPQRYVWNEAFQALFVFQRVGKVQPSQCSGFAWDIWGDCIEVCRGIMPCTVLLLKLLFGLPAAFPSLPYFVELFYTTTFIKGPLYD